MGNNRFSKIKSRLSFKPQPTSNVSLPLPASPYPTDRHSAAHQHYQKAIRAIRDYTPSSKEELAFSQGDFFYVLRDYGPCYFEACNPVTGVRGLVPVDYVEVLERGQRRKHSSVRASTDNTAVPKTRSGSSPLLLAVVKYDFRAEYPQELGVSAGEHLVIIDVVNNEWLAAKPIGRLGGPGIVPASYVEIRDLHTGSPIPNALSLLLKTKRKVEQNHPARNTTPAVTELPGDEEFEIPEYSEMNEDGKWNPDEIGGIDSLIESLRVMAEPSVPLPSQPYQHSPPRKQRQPTSSSTVSSLSFSSSTSGGSSFASSSPPHPSQFYPVPNSIAKQGDMQTLVLVPVFSPNVWDDLMNKILLSPDIRRIEPFYPGGNENGWGLHS
ncbi:uncharacterized protein VTP21DRAFT_4414 [Calcarisporiella thermophila]|uniref:uncharacterized protein n=1 Tax=Calcarisporiella thermophila TaxID=911321 RepID=UPI0037449402